jgi:hypothetical protein
MICASPKTNGGAATLPCSRLDLRFDKVRDSVEPNLDGLPRCGHVSNVRQRLLLYDAVRLRVCVLSIVSSI